MQIHLHHVVCENGSWAGVGHNPGQFIPLKAEASIRAAPRTWASKADYCLSLKLLVDVFKYAADFPLVDSSFLRASSASDAFKTIILIFKWRLERKKEHPRSVSGCVSVTGRRTTLCQRSRRWRDCRLQSEHSAELIAGLICCAD